MSRIGVKPITLPSDVTVTMSGAQIEVKGPKGSLSQPALKGIKVEQSDNQLLVTRANNGRQTRAFHGLMRSILSNLVQGVTEGYQKKLELVGTGYRAKKQGDNITLSVGYSHPVEYIAPEGIVLNTEGDTVISVSGINKQLVGEVAAKIRAVRKPEPYKGKGIRYQGEVIRRKAGKATKVGSS
jgi:large subunit ribosomal protein L6